MDSGQIQLANHTWTHADLTRCSGGTIESELRRCERLLNTTFGVTGKPFLRPPYGARNHFVDGVAASLGYTSMTTWYGSFGDSGHISEKTLLNLARKWLRPQAIVIGHANLPMVTHLYGPIVDIIRSRVDSLGVAEPEISRQGNNIVIDLPGVKNAAEKQRAIGAFEPWAS